MREFRVIASASADQLQEAIKGKDRTYGDPLTPNFLYDEMKRSKWFATLEVSLIPIPRSVPIYIGKSPFLMTNRGLHCNSKDINRMPKSSLVGFSKR